MTEHFDKKYALFTYDNINNRWTYDKWDVRPHGNVLQPSMTKGFIIEMGKPSNLNSFEELNDSDRKQLKESFGKMFS